MTALEPREAGAFMQRLGPALVSAFGRPRAILALSAHTLARQPTLLAAPQHQAVYDFGGFPAELSTLRYDAPGAPALADTVQALLQAAGLPVQSAEAGGLDHGIWTPLRYMFPDADIPVLPLAWVPSWSPAQLSAFGAALAPLAEQGVLIVGTGSVTHNLRLVYAGGQPPVDAPEIAESAQFRAWVQAQAAAADRPALHDYRVRAPHAALMHPTDEHWLPFYPAAGAGGAEFPGLRLHESITYGCLAMDCYAFGAQAPRLVEAMVG